MKYTLTIFPVLALAVLGMTPIDASENALREWSLCDSLLNVKWQSNVGERPSFDLNHAGTKRFDANGDGVADLVSVTKDDNGVPITMTVFSPFNDTIYFVVDMNAVRSQIFADGFESGNLAAMKFERFARLTDGLHIAIFSAEGAPIFYDPSNGYAVGANPDQARLLAVTDFEQDGWAEVVIFNKEEKRVQVLASQFEPGAGQ